MTKPDKILLLPICGFGDSVAYLPYLQAIRTTYPKAEILVVVATEYAGAILKDNTSNVEIVVFNRKDHRGRWDSLLNLIRSIRRRKFNVVVSGAHPNSVRVPVFAFLSGAKLRIGAQSERLSFLYNRRVSVSTHAHYKQRYQSLLKAIEVPVSDVNASPRMQPPEAAKATAGKIWSDAGLDSAETVVGLVSGADKNVRGLWQPGLKRWNNQGYADVAKWAVQNCSARIVMLGSEPEAAIADEIAVLSGVAIVNLCGKTELPEMQWIISKCSAIVSNDTGIMHLAGALGTQVLALFGPTSHESFRPPGDQNRFIQGQAPCAPCYPHPTCDLKRCRAMDNIAAPDVISNLSLLLMSEDRYPVSQS